MNWDRLKPRFCFPPTESTQKQKQKKDGGSELLLPLKRDLSVFFFWIDVTKVQDHGKTILTEIEKNSIFFSKLRRKLKPWDS